MTPLVSVLLPYRDAGETLEEALASILDERGVDLEVIAIDDGSRDDGPARVARRALDDRRVVVTSTSEWTPAGTRSPGDPIALAVGADPRVVAGRGIAGALRHGLGLARGEFIARMDADDISLPGRLERQIEALSSDPCLGVVGTRVEAFPEPAVGEGMRRYVAWQNALVTPEDHARELFIESPLCHPSVLIRRRALEEVGGWREGPWPEDYDLWLRLDTGGFRIAKVPEVLLRWRHRPGRATFSDPRYALARFVDAKGHYLAPRLMSMGRPAAVWGAGKTGRRIARALAGSGVKPELFIDIDPRKIGRTAQGAPILSPVALERGRHTLVVAVGARGARDLIRAHLNELGFEEGTDYVCAA